LVVKESIRLLQGLSTSYCNEDPLLYVFLRYRLQYYSEIFGRRMQIIPNPTSHVFSAWDTLHWDFTKNFGVNASLARLALETDRRTDRL